MYASTEQIAAQSENGCPDDTAQSVEDKKSPRGQPVCAGEHCGESAEQSDKAAEEDDRATVPGEQISTQHSFSRIEADEMAPPLQQRFTKLSARPEANIVPDNRSARGSSYDPTNVQRVLCASEYGGADQDRGMPALSSMTTKKTAA
jgi:hypothetical protein